MGEGGRRNHQVDGATAAYLTTRVDNRGVDSAVGPSTAWIEGDGFKVRLDVLKLQLAAGPHQLVACGMRSTSQLSQRQGRNRDVGWEPRGIDGSQVDRDRGIEQAAIVGQVRSEA